MAAGERSYGSLEGQRQLPGRDASQKEASGQQRPPVLIVHGALVVVFVCFGGGSFVSKFGIHGASPLMFELVREAVVGPIFCIAAKWLQGCWRPELRDLPRVLLVGTCFALAQALYFLGLKHENPMVSSTWQAALPIFTTAVAVLLGHEEISCRKASGIAIASGGAMWMTLGTVLNNNARSSSSTLEGSAARSLIDRIDGHALLCGQCIVNSVYIVMSKPIVVKYGGVPLSGWMFGIGSLCFLAFVFVARAIPGLSWFACMDASADITAGCVHALLQIPSTMFWPLVYEILFCSLVAWCLLTWSLQHAQASVVSVYTVFQPCTTCVLSVMAICIKGKSWAERYGIDVPGVHNLLGGVLIGAGLWVMLAEDTAARARASVKGGEEDAWEADKQKHVKGP